MKNTLITLLLISIYFSTSVSADARLDTICAQPSAHTDESWLSVVINAEKATAASRLNTLKEAKIERQCLEAAGKESPITFDAQHLSTLHHHTGTAGWPNGGVFKSTPHS